MRVAGASRVPTARRACRRVGGPLEAGGDGSVSSLEDRRHAGVSSGGVVRAMRLQIRSHPADFFGFEILRGRCPDLAPVAAIALLAGLECGGSVRSRDPEALLFLSPSHVTPRCRAVCARRPPWAARASRISQASTRSRVSRSASPGRRLASIGGRIARRRSEKWSGESVSPGSASASARWLVLELADVAGPRVADADVDRARARAPRRDRQLQERAYADRWPERGLSGRRRRAPRFGPRRSAGRSRGQRPPPAA